LTSASAVNNVVAAVLVRQWEQELGVRLGVEQMAFNPYIEKIHKHDFALGRSSWSGDYPDPTTFLDMLRATDSNNFSQWRDVEFDALLAQASRTIDPTTRLGLLRQAEIRLLGQAPISPVYHSVTLHLFDPSRVDLRPNPWSNFRLDLAGVRAAPSAQD
jgi:oligopeptide transport system substrate-binding protein